MTLTQGEVDLLINYYDNDGTGTLNYVRPQGKATHRGTKEMANPV